MTLKFNSLKGELSIEIFFKKWNFHQNVTFHVPHAWLGDYPCRTHVEIFMTSKF